jgi:hypothetical protein
MEKPPYGSKAVSPFAPQKKEIVRRINPLL